MGGTNLAGESISSSAIENALNGGSDVTLQADNDINVNEVISYNQGKLELNAGNSIYINKDINVTSNGDLSLVYAQASGNTTGNYYVQNGAKVNLVYGVVFKTKKASESYIPWIIVRSAIDLQNISSAKMGSYVVGSDIDLSGVDWMTIGNATVNNQFRGKFDGLGHTISNLTINKTSSSYQGLFGYTLGASIRNIGLLNVDIQGNMYVGGLVGRADLGEIVNSYVTGNIQGTNYVGGLLAYTSNTIIQNSYVDTSLNDKRVYGTNNVGGLVGYNYGTIKNSYSTGKVEGNNQYIGGLVGYNLKDIENSYSTAKVTGTNTVGGLVGKNESIGKISKSYYKGDVEGYYRVGGLAGENAGKIYNTYSMGTVTSTGEGYPVGGLIGYNTNIVENSYSNMKVTGQGDDVGGLIGSSTVTPTGSYYDKTVNPTLSENGHNIGKTTAELQNIDTYSYFLTPWDIVEDSTLEKGTPILSWQKGKTEPIWIIGTKLPVVSVVYNLGDKSQTYNGQNVLLNSLWSASTIFGNDYLSWVLGTDYNFVDSNNNILTSYINAGTYNDILIKVLKSGYDIASSGNVVGSLVINKADATVTANSDTKTYNGLNQSVNGFTVSGLVNNETSSVLTGIVGDSVSGKNAGVYDTNLSGDDTNYNLTFVNGKLTINKAELDIIANSDSKVYNGQTQSVSGYIFGTNGLLGSDTSSNINLLNTITTSSSKNVGTYATNISGSADNYNINVTQGKLDITKADATVTANSDTKIYNGLNQSVNGFTVSGLVNNETKDVLTNVTGASANGKNAGVYDTNLSGDDTNYNLTFVDGKLIIEQKELTISDIVAQGKIYDGTNQAILSNSGSLVGLVEGERLKLTNNLVEFDNKDAGENKTVIASGYTITDGTDGDLASNYKLTQTTKTTTAKIYKKDLIVKLNDDLKVYDGIAYSGGKDVVYSGFVNNETKDILKGSLVYSGNSQGAINVGEYAISVSGLSADNYSIIYLDGKLTVFVQNNPVVPKNDVSKDIEKVVNNIEQITQSSQIATNNYIKNSNSNLSQNQNINTLALNNRVGVEIINGGIRMPENIVKNLNQDEDK